MTTTLSVGHGEIDMPMPDRTDMECRQSGPDWLLRLGRLHVWADLEPLLSLHHKITAALVDAGYGDEIDGTVRALMIQGGSE